MTRLHEGHVALVTGAAQGIGAAAAEVFAREGAKVVVADAKVDGGLERVESLRAGGAEAEFVEVDVTREDSVAAMVARSVELYGRLDCAMNNAGITDPMHPFDELTLENWERMIAVNLTGVFLCMKHELRQMAGQEPRDGRRGAIVNTSSGAGIVPAPGQPHYTAAKHGVLGLTKVAGSEYYARGIRANAICPGVTETPMVRQSIGFNQGAEEKLRSTVPGGEFGRPEDVASAAVWLCSEQARWVNGQGLIVDGGGVMR